MENRPNKIVVIASSTGGPNALHKMLPTFPGDFPYPVVIVQHIWPGFTGHLAESLNEQCALSVSKAKHLEQVLGGHIYIAPAKKHLRIRKGTAGLHLFELSEEEPVNGVMPSADVLLKSLESSTFKKIVIIVLSGMGTDGAAGIEELSKCRAIDVLVQDEESSVVYGMPGNAIKSFKDASVLALSEIKDKVMKLMEV